jgi:hypothetical protein
MSENLEDSSVWNDDRLSRSKDAAFLKTFLLRRIEERKEAGLPGSYVLNIDARWGQGKSFFLDRFGQSLRSEGFLVASVNAWQDDHAEDPLLSVMAAIDEAVAPLIKREKQVRERWNTAKRTGAAIAVAAAKGAAVQLAKRAIGSGVDEIGAILNVEVLDAAKPAEEISKALGESIGEQGKVLLERFREGKRTIASFRKGLADFLRTADEKKQRLPLFILIDELDRCRPPFAIAMLERIKHLFEIDQVVFVVATDTVQLGHSIRAVYGAGFNSEGYLSRFFNRTYFFERLSRRDFVKGLFERLPLDKEKISLPPQLSITKYLVDAFDFFELPLRDVEQVYDILRSIVTTWDFRLKIEMVVLLPIAIAHQQGVELSPDQDFTSILNRIAQKNGGTKPGRPWQLIFVDHGSYPPKEQPVDGVALAGDMMTHARRSLPDLNHSVSTAHSRWAVTQLADEFALLHGNSFRNNVRPYSVLLQYPEMVRSAGRLVPRAVTK